MSMQDPIADMLTRIRNAHQAQKTTVEMPSSKLKRGIAQVLLDEGFVNHYEENSDNSKHFLTIHLKYFNEQPVIGRIQRVSKPSLRVYKKSTELPKVLGGLGVAIITTSYGVMSDKQARQQSIGGEVLCFVE